MKNFISIFILLLGLTASQVMAIPVLQLTIDGGPTTPALKQQ
jgi:hypothetical protein